LGAGRVVKDLRQVIELKTPAPRMTTHQWHAALKCSIYTTPCTGQRPQA
jgi:hypothetical protein